ncbi:uncharacterized protein LOC114539418 [Dendronephthya gigantea]|uniref:uncharacterized protein LOC114539418 n=1 Tax=Dendronephthya gigantea TaxID=151771 RepID=UPI00106A9D97|nr:uncharacterized protein LOC114539418 [Dendronephthya gigantea]
MDVIKHLRKDIRHKEHRNSLNCFRCALCNEDFIGEFDYIHHLKHKWIHRYDLHQAACCGRFQEVGQLIFTEDANVTGASHQVNPSSQLGFTPMHCAAFRGYSRCLKVMLSWPDGNPNIPDQQGQTPVHLAARCGRATSLRLLLDNGGKLDLKDESGQTPIQLARCHDDCMNEILIHQILAMFSKFRLKTFKVASRKDEETNENVEGATCAEISSEFGAFDDVSRWACQIAAMISELRRKKITAKRSISLEEHNETSDSEPKDYTEDSCFSEKDLETNESIEKLGASSVDDFSELGDSDNVTHCGNLEKICSSVIDDVEKGQEIIGTGTNKIITECRFTEVSSEMLPYEILARGEHAVDAFKTALAEGTASASRLKIIVVGEVGAGKTSLTRSLCGQPFIDTREKTRGIQTASISEPIITSSKVDETWKHADPNESHCDELTARCVNLPGLPWTSENFDLRELVDQLAVTTYPGLQTPSIPTLDSPEYVRRVVTEPSVTIQDSPRKYPATLVARKLSSAATEESSVKKIFWDFAGHQLYEPMHHVFMNSNSLYLVVFNLLKMSKSPEKSLRKIHYWLNSIASHTSSSTPVMLVGTQKLRVNILVDSQFIHTARGFCEEKFAHMFGNRLVRSLDDDILFVVENSNAHDDAGIVKLKDAIARDISASGKTWFVNQELPLKWLHCEEEIIEHQKDPESKKCLDISAVKELLEDKCQTTFSDHEFNSMLTFFHDSGLILLPGIMHDVSEESVGKDLVILSPQYLVDIMTSIHEVPKNNENHFKRQFSNEFKKLKEEGRVAGTLLEHIWKDKVEDVDVLAELLSSFKLLHALYTESDKKVASCPTEAKEFIIPCMLKDKSDESFSKRWLKACKDWEDLTETEHKFVFDFGGFLPPPLFDYFLVHVYHHSCKSKGMKPILQRRGGIFSISNRYLFCTKLVLKDCQIWVHARCKKGEHFSHLASVLKKKVSEICRQYFKFLKFICGPPCPHKDCPGATFNADDLQRPCESSSSGSEKSSESGEDEAGSSTQNRAVTSSKCGDNEKRIHVISVDPESYHPPYWCRSVDLSKLLSHWNPDLNVQKEIPLPALAEEDMEELKECAVDECCITNVSNKLGNNWKDLGRELSVEESKMDNISEENHEQKERGIKVILSWKNHLGSSAVVSLLASALKKISRKDLAEQLVSHCKNCHSSKN